MSISGYIVSYDGNTYSTQLKGWRVLKVDTENDIVTLVHAGIPECYYWKSSVVQTSLENRGQVYLNNEYATEAHIMSSDEAIAITGSASENQNNTLRYLGIKTGGFSPRYWMYKETDDRYNNNMVGSTGKLDRTVAAEYYGIRPIVTLKAGIKTSGQGTDVVGNENSWLLIKSVS